MSNDISCTSVNTVHHKLNTLADLQNCPTLLNLYVLSFDINRETKHRILLFIIISGQIVITRTMKNVATIIAIIALLGTFCQSFPADQLPFVSLDTVVLNDAIKPVAPPQPLPGGGKVTGFPSFLSSDLPPQTISQLPQTFSAPVLQPINVPIPTIFNGGYKGDSAVVPIAVEGLY